VSTAQPRTEHSPPSARVVLILVLALLFAAAEYGIFVALVTRLSAFYLSGMGGRSQLGVPAQSVLGVSDLVGAYWYGLLALVLGAALLVALRTRLPVKRLALILGAALLVSFAVVLTIFPPVINIVNVIR
jgi:hypothetical protein